MKISYNSDYLSISKFKSFEISNFTIITGINGSGKSHFLQALENGSINIENISDSEIIYYDTNDFIVYTQDRIKSPRLQNKKNKWSSTIPNFLQQITTKKQRVLTKIEPKSILELSILNLFLNVPKFESLIEDLDLETNFLKLKKNKPENLVHYINKNPNLFSPTFYNLLNNYFIASNGNLEQFTKENIIEIASNIQSKIDKEINSDELVSFIRKNIKNKDYEEIVSSDFSSPFFILKDIEDFEKNYQLRKARNIYNFFKFKNYGEDVPYLTNDEFILKNGKSPVELINEVLNEYDCNGYFLKTNNNIDFLGKDINSIKYDITLENRIKNINTSFENLSSGEKILISLSILIYKTRLNKISPRVLLLDEIDSSLHPSMIKRLLNVIKNIFVNEYEFKVIMTTHSPTTVALSEEKSIYAIINNGNFNLIKDSKSNIIKSLTEGIATFNEEDSDFEIMYNIEKTNLPVLFTEGVTDKIILNTAWSKLYNSNMPFYIQDVFCASFLSNLFKRGDDLQDGIYNNYPKKTFIGLFDFDYEGYNYWDGFKKNYYQIENNPYLCLTKKHPNNDGYLLLLPVPENSIIKDQVISNGFNTFKNEAVMSIELLFYGVKELEDYFYAEKTKGGGQIIIFKGNKRKFATSVNQLNKESFNNFKKLFEKILDIIS